jgi:hypothetical protein
VEKQPGRQGLRAGADVRLRALLQEQEKLPWMQPSISALALNATGATLPRHLPSALRRRERAEGRCRGSVPRRFDRDAAVKGLTAL